MAKLIACTRYPESREVGYTWDDGSESIFNERTKEWTLWRIPTHNEILGAASGDVVSQASIATYANPIRYTPPVLADAPRHNAEVEDETDD